MIFVFEVVQHRDQHEDDVKRQAFEVGDDEVQLTHRNRRGNLAIERGGIE